MNGDHIHFDNVREFVMENIHHSSPDNMTFPNLEELHMCYSDDSFEVWSQFIEKHPDLMRLHIVESFSTDLHERFESFTDDLHNLDEISIVCKRSVNVEAVTKLLGGHEKLMKLDLAKLTDDAMEVLRAEHESKWIITALAWSHFNGLSFEKRK